MADSFIGEIRILTYTFPPLGWAYCTGSQVAINQYQALYAVIGNLYTATPNQQYFNLPNLQGLAVVGQGSGPGLTPRTIAVGGGAATVTLSSAQVPLHTHAVSATFPEPPPPKDSNVTAVPTSACALACEQTEALLTFSDLPANATLGASTIGLNVAAAAAHPNQQPYLVLSFCISFEGAFPVRP